MSFVRLKVIATRTKIVRIPRSNRLVMYLTIYILHRTIKFKKKTAMRDLCESTSLPSFELFNYIKVLKLILRCVIYTKIQMCWSIRIL